MLVLQGSCVSRACVLRGGGHFGQVCLQHALGRSLSMHAMTVFLTARPSVKPSAVFFHYLFPSLRSSSLEKKREERDGIR